jgi:PhnB protein
VPVRRVVGVAVEVVQQLPSQLDSLNLNAVSALMPGSPFGYAALPGGATAPASPASPGGSAAAERVDTIGRSGRWGARRVPPITWLQEKTMSSRLNPYLNFNGNARQALEFYQSVFGGTLDINTFADFGGNDSPDADKVMHGQLETGAGYTLMAADHASNMGDYHPPSGFGVSLSGDDGDVLRGYWEKLSAGGNTTMPMQKQAWGDEFGMVVDKFGITWLVNISQPQA